MLPFLLRRLKEDVLNDLPPKIIQDYHCNLSELQKRLYDAFTHSQALSSAQDAVKNGESSGAPGQKHVFQSLQYLRKICNHPALVLKSEEDLRKASFSDVSMKDVRNIENAPKLLALRYFHP